MPKARRGGKVFRVGRFVEAIRVSPQGEVSAVVRENPRRGRNITAGFYDEDGMFHPIRASSDYDPNRTGEKAKRRTSKAVKSKASKTTRKHVKAVKGSHNRKRSTARKNSSHSRSVEQYDYRQQSGRKRAKSKGKPYRPSTGRRRGAKRAASIVKRRRSR